MHRNYKRLLALALSTALTLSCVAPAAGASSVPEAVSTASAIQLDSYLTKEMNYFAKGDARIPTDGWVRDAETYGGDLALLPFLGLSDEVKAQFGDIGADVTIALKDKDGVYWAALGEKGIIRVDFSEEDTRDIFQYFFGPRYIYDGNDAARSTVTGLRSDGEHGIWVENSEGAVHIRMVERTLREKADVYAQINDKLNTFRGTIIDSNVKPYDMGNDNSDGAPASDTELAPNTGEWMEIVEPDGTVRKFQQLSKYGDNNDSYWTGVSLLGYGNEYAALSQSDDPEDQAAAEEARTRVVNGAMNCMLLSKIHGTGDGFVIRNYKFTDEPGGGVAGKITYQLTKGEGNTDVTKIEAGDRFTVQNLGNMAKAWNGQEVKYFPTESYFGDGLPNFAMGEETATQPDAGIDVVTGETMASPGYMLMEDIYGPNGKNDPVIAAAYKAYTDAGNPVKIYSPYVSWNTPVYQDGPDGKPVLQPNREEGHDWAFSYVVTEDVSDKYPELVAKFSVADPNQPTRPGYGGQEDMTRLTYYTDTSSEEPTGQFASYFALYYYVLQPELADPDTSPERRAEDEKLLELLRDSAATTFNHIVDNGYVLMDPCGHQTTWGKWNRDYFNWDCDPETEGVQNHVFMPDAILNSAEMVMFTRVTLELLEGVKDDTETSTGINIVDDSPVLVSGADGYATYKSAYEKVAAEYEKMKQPLAEDSPMDPFTAITPNDPKNGVGYLELMQQFNQRQKAMIQYWIDDITYTLADVDANGGAVSAEAAMKSMTAHDYYNGGEAMSAEDREYLETALATYQDAYKNNDYASTGNFSDALMYFCVYLPLSTLTKDESDVFPKVQNAFSQIYDGQLKAQEIPFDAFLMKFIDPNHPGIDQDLENATRQLVRTPQYLMNYSGTASYNGVFRKDTLWFEVMDWYDHETSGSTNVYPFDERRASKFNTNILAVDDASYQSVQEDFASGSNHTDYTGNIYMYDPTPFTSGYWLGINLGYIAEGDATEGDTVRYTYAQVQDSFSDDGAQGTVKQYVAFLTDPSYGTGNDAAFSDLDLANTQTFVNKDFTVKPSIFPSLRGVNASVLSADRTQLWMAYAAGGVDCVNVESGEVVASYSARQLTGGSALLLVLDEDAGVIYLVTEDGVTQLDA